MEVKLQPGGEVFDVAEGETVLEAALRAGYPLPHSCRGGSCTSCRARILEGRVTYPGRPPAGLSDAEAAAGDALLCVAHAASDLVVRARPVETPADVRIRRLPCRVHRMERLSSDVMGVWLKLPAVEPFAFLAGQYVDILLRGGRRRSFSIASRPEAGEPLELHVRLVPGGHFTRYVFEELQPRSLLRLEGPLGGFFLREDEGQPLILVGGGTGLAPLKSMIEDSRARGATRPMHLYWGVRSEADLYAKDTLAEWDRALPHFRYTTVLSEPEAGWVGRTGWVHEAVLADHPDLSGVAVYASGPPPMISAIQRDFPRQGLSPERLYFDSFEYAADTAELAEGA